MNSILFQSTFDLIVVRIFLCMIFPYFTNDQITPLIVSSTILVVSMMTFLKGRKQLGLILLFLGSVGLGFFMANLDPFLILWDEQYHALVAKNMLDNPFKPTLYSNPILEYDYRNWTNNHIWLHKQPLFLWQIALSLKMFGINELAVRIPSILLHTIAVLMIYRIGKIVCNSNIGYYGALFFSVAYFPLELVAGRFSTDHNDIAFLFYLIASFWSWFEYQQSQKKYWIIFIGVFAGSAVLVKWLVGLLIYAVWAISLGANDKRNWLNWKSYLPIVMSSLISVMVFLPWQIYILYDFPLEAHYELTLNTKHFYQVIENHGGNFWFHFEAFKNLYGSGYAVPFLLILGLFFLVKKSISKVYSVSILSSIIIIYVFYSIAATKMLSFCIIVSPFFFLGFGALVDSAINFLKIKVKLKNTENSIRFSILIFICFLLMNISRIQNNHTNKEPVGKYIRNTELREMAFITKLSKFLGESKYVVFNTVIRENDQIPVMFYTNYIAYNFIPDLKQIDRIRKKAYKIAILDTGNLPDYICNDEQIVKIKI